LNSTASPPREFLSGDYRPTRKLLTPAHNPTACNTHIATTTTTTTFRIDLMLEAMGMKRLIRPNATPTTTSTMTRLIKGMSCSPINTEGNPLPNGEAAIDVAGTTLSGADRRGGNIRTAPRYPTTPRHLTKCGQN
jgi:hypothetical protein